MKSSVDREKKYTRAAVGLWQLVGWGKSVMLTSAGSKPAWASVLGYSPTHPPGCRAATGRARPVLRNMQGGDSKGIIVTARQGRTKNKRGKLP